MKFKPGTRTRIRISLELDFDPTGTDVELCIDGVWRPATWEGASVEDPVTKTWTQSARTVNYFAGPDVADPAGAIVLDRGRHMTATQVTSGMDVITADSSPIDVA